MNTLCVFVAVSTKLRFTFNISVGDLFVKYEIGMSNSYKNYCAMLCRVPYLFALYFFPLHKDGMTNVRIQSALWKRLLFVFPILTSLEINRILKL